MEQPKSSKKTPKSRSGIGGLLRIFTKSLEDVKGNKPTISKCSDPQTAEKRSKKDRGRHTSRSKEHETSNADVNVPDEKHPEDKSQGDAGGRKTEIKLPKDEKDVKPRSLSSVEPKTISNKRPQNLIDQVFEKENCNEIEDKKIDKLCDKNPQVSGLLSVDTENVSNNALHGKGEENVNDRKSKEHCTSGPSINMITPPPGFKTISYKITNDNIEVVKIDNFEEQCDDTKTAQIQENIVTNRKSEEKCERTEKCVEVSEKEHGQGDIKPARVKTRTKRGSKVKKSYSNSRPNRHKLKSNFEDWGNDLLDIEVSKTAIPISQPERKTSNGGPKSRQIVHDVEQDNQPNANEDHKKLTIKNENDRENMEKPPNDRENIEKPPNDPENTEKPPTRPNDPENIMNTDKPPNDHENIEKTPNDRENIEKTPNDRENIEKTPNDHENTEKPSNDRENTEKPPNDRENTEKPPNDRENMDKPPNDRENTEKPPNDRENTEKPPNDCENTDKPPNDHENTEKPSNYPEKMEKPPNDRENTEKPPNDRENIEKPPNDRENTEKPPNDRENTEKPPNDCENTDKPPNDHENTEKPSNYPEKMEKPPNDRENMENAKTEQNIKVLGETIKRDLQGFIEESKHSNIPETKDNENVQQTRSERTVLSKTFSEYSRTNRSSTIVNRRPPRRIREQTWQRRCSRVDEWIAVKHRPRSQVQGFGGPNHRNNQEPSSCSDGNTSEVEQNKTEHCLKESRNELIRVKEKSNFNFESGSRRTTHENRGTSHRSRFSIKIDQGLSSSHPKRSTSLPRTSLPRNFPRKEERKKSVEYVTVFSNEDWSEELIETTPIKIVPPKTCEDVAEVTRDLKSLDIDTSAQETNDKLNELCIEYFKETVSMTAKEEKIVPAQELDVSDGTIVNTSLEDWSCEFLVVPSSRNTSPQGSDAVPTEACFENDAPSDEYVVDTSESSAIRTKPGNIPKHRQSIEQEEELCNVDFEEDWDDVCCQDIPVEKPRLKTNYLLRRFVDDNSDMTSDPERYSDLESQAPSSIETESLNDDNTLSREILEEDYYFMLANEQKRRAYLRDNLAQQGFQDRSIPSEPEDCCGDLPRNSQNHFEKFQKHPNFCPPQFMQNYPQHHPCFRVPIDKMSSRESVEMLMDFINSRKQGQNDHSNIWFSIDKNQGTEDLTVGWDPSDDPRAQNLPHHGYPWPWPYYPWPPYPDPSQNPANMASWGNMYEAYYGNFPYPHHQREDPAYQKMSQQVDQPSVTSDKRIVDYDSSSEDEKRSLFNKRQRTMADLASIPLPTYPQPKSYASCFSTKQGTASSLRQVMGVRDNEKTQKEPSGRFHKLGAPKRARTLFSTDRNLNEKDEMCRVEEDSSSNTDYDQAPLVRHAKIVCEQFSVGEGKVYRSVPRIPQTGSRHIDTTHYTHHRQSRCVIREESDDEECFVREKSTDKENESDVKSPGYYPYQSYVEKTKSEGEPRAKPSRWAAWGMDKSTTPVQRREANEQTPRKVLKAACKSDNPQAPSPNGEDQNTSSNSSGLTPQMMSLPFWSDPRMPYHYHPPYFSPPHWVSRFPLSPGYMPCFPPPPPPPPPSHTSPPGQAPACSPNSASPSCASASQFPGSRSRTSSAPSTDIDKLLNDTQGERRACTSILLAAKNRRVSDSVLRSTTDDLVSRRSSYASRLQNDARLNANFPQLDWKIRYKSRMKRYDYTFIDSHCHIDFLYNREGFKGSFAKYMAKHEETFPDNFDGCVAVFCNPATFMPYGGLWKEVASEDNVWLAMGCHPKMVTDFDTVAMDGLKKCLQHPKIVALGEIGLDYSGTFRQHEEIQKKMFIYQLQLALDLKLPLVIHCRDAEDDCLEIMEKIVPRNYKIHCHCFTGSFTECEKWLNKFPNLFIGLTNLVSFRSATPTHEVARHIPLDRLLLETDAPYFIPRMVPKSEYEYSHPGMAICVAEEIARIRNIRVDRVLQACRENTRRMYGV